VQLCAGALCSSAGVPFHTNLPVKSLPAFDHMWVLIGIFVHITATATQLQTRQLQPLRSYYPTQYSHVGGNTTG
jgi:hypothetical protein